MTGGTYALILSGPALALLIAMFAPAPARAPETEPAIPTVLLVAACSATLLMGAFALSDHHLSAVVCGAAAWLVVVPCLWLARAPDGYGWEEEDDDDGGSPRPGSPSAPPAPDDRLPGLDPSGVAGARGAWVAGPAVSFTPATAEAPLPAWAMRQGSPAWAMARAEERAVEPPFAGESEDLYEELPITDPVWAPAPVTAPACEQSDASLKRPARESARRVRGEHRSVGHVHARAGAHSGSRRRRGSLPQRVLRACRRWLGVESPECRRRARLDAIEHGGRRHGSPARSRSDLLSR